MTHTANAPHRFAAPASLDYAADVPEIAPGTEGGRLHDIFEAWSHWSRTRRYYCPPPKSGTILGQLSSKTRAFSSGPPDAACNAELAALHLAILAQPVDALDTQVFYAYYGLRCGSVKQTAGALQISRGHFYRLLTAFCARTYAASKALVQANEAQRDALPHYVSTIIK